MNTQSSKFRVIAAVSAVALGPNITFGDSVVLWNKLGSDSEVTNSEIGPGGAVVGSQYGYEPGKFGNGYIRKAIGANYAEFPPSVVDQIRNRGTLAVWIIPKVPSPQPYEYGIFGLAGTPYGWAWLSDSHPYSNVYLMWGDGVTDRGFTGQIGADNDPDAVRTPPESVQFVSTPGIPFHAAIAWDIDGINGTADRIQIFRDGKVVSSSTSSWNPNFPELYSIVLGYGPDSGGYDRFVTDNLIIWDYAKTDFSDRFIENPMGKSFGVFSPRAEFTLGPKANDDSYWVRGWLKLAKASNGIDPLTEAVTIKVGPFSHTLPAGSFKQDGTSYLFKGPVGPSTLDVRITASPKPGGYSFKSCLKQGELAATTMQPQVQLTIGDDQGQAALDVGYAKFGTGKHGQNWVFPTAK